MSDYRDEESDQVREDRIREAIDDWPMCEEGTMELESYHERDSTYDTHRCDQCGWFYLECEAWSLP